MNFLDQQYDDKGKPLGPEKYKEIVKERYFIAKHSHISYDDTGKMTPRERDYIQEFIVDDLKRQQDYVKNMTQEMRTKGGKIKRG